MNICHLNKRTESTGAFCSLFFGAAMSHVPTEGRMANLSTWVYIVVFMKPPTRLQVCGCFQKYGYPKMDDGLEWKPLLKLMIWGYPCFWKNPCSASCFSYAKIPKHLGLSRRHSRHCSLKSDDMRSYDPLHLRTSNGSLTSGPGTLKPKHFAFGASLTSAATSTINFWKPHEQRKKT